jgi:hypothetical protein
MERGAEAFFRVWRRWSLYDVDGSREGFPKEWRIIFFG